MTTPIKERMPARIESDGRTERVGRARPRPDAGPDVEVAQGRIDWGVVLWAGWILGIAAAWGAGGFVASAAWWILYWPVIMTGAMVYSRLGDGPEAPRRTACSGDGARRR
jgi:hypothetical protein